MKRFLLLLLALSSVVHAQTTHLPAPPFQPTPPPEIEDSLGKMRLAAMALMAQDSGMDGLSDVSTSNVALSANGAMPLNYPPAIWVKRIPLGSGAPTPGMTTGYERADAVSGGLYHVPGYLPFDPTPQQVPARVVQLPCIQRDGKWLCDGYSINPGTTRGENIMIQPVFQH